MRHLAYWYWRLRGWKFVGKKPDVPRYVVVAVPHTSNWDFVLFLAAVKAFDLPARYIGKHTLFKPPFGRLMRRWGGIPVHRGQGANTVKEVAEEIHRMDEAAVVITPEGTRGTAEFWKSGFYHIARAAGVPILLAKDDWDEKAVTLGPLIDPSGNIKADMDQIRAFYEGIPGKKRDKQGPIRLKEEG